MNTYALLTSRLPIANEWVALAKCNAKTWQDACYFFEVDPSRASVSFEQKVISSDEAQRYGVEETIATMGLTHPIVH